MLGYKRIVIAQNERGLHLYDRRLAAILEPGIYRWLDPLNRHEVQRYDLTVAEFDHPWLDVLLKTDAALVERHFQVVETGDRQVGLIYKNGRLDGVLPPATRRVYWRGSGRGAGGADRHRHRLRPVAGARRPAGAAVGGAGQESDRPYSGRRGRR
jgi:hypothetical protein